MTRNKRQNFEPSRQYVNIALYPLTHKVLTFLAGDDSFDTYLRKLILNMKDKGKLDRDVETALSELKQFDEVLEKRKREPVALVKKKTQKKRY